MGFAVSQHLRARHWSGNVLILGFFFSPEGQPFGLFMKENGDIAIDSVENLQGEIHFDREANDWKDDWEPELPDGAIPLGPEYPGVFVVGEADDDQEEADGDPPLQGPDLPDL